MVAISRGLVADRFVFVASPQSYRGAVREFASSNGLNEDEIETVIDSLVKSGVRVDILASDLLPQFDMPGLVIHSSDDDIIPIETGKQIAASWKNCRFIEVHGLGHRKILRDRQVINIVIDFICEKSFDQTSSQLETLEIRNQYV
jgi:pimeloyl-ACP methyl ester carboxylesterase